MSPTQLLVPTFTHLLKALSGWLTKAREQLPPAEAEALLSASLAPDMFPLSTQIRFACVQVLEAHSRLTESPFPDTVRALLDEGRNARERPGSLADCHNRIEETVALLAGLAPDALDADPATLIAHELPNGMIFDLTPDQYARDWALSQFYFHVMTAYAILRSGKVALGKADYVPHMLPYVRPGVLPT